MEVKQIINNPDEIKAILSDRVSKKNKFSNYFFQKVEKDAQLLYTDKTAVIIVDYRTYKRIFFVSDDETELYYIINGLTSDRYVINYPTKGDKESIELLMGKCGFKHSDTFIRMVNTKFKQGKTDSVVYAKKSQADQIISLLNRHFVDYLSYIPEKEEMQNLIEQKSVIINEDNGNVSGVMIVEIQGKKAYFRIWCDEGRNGLKLLNDAFAIAASKGLKYEYNWINETNKVSMSVYKFFGSQPDGLKDYIFVKEIN